MTEREGTIRFAYELKAPDAANVPPALLATLGAWREICLRLGLVGRQPERYDGLGFGNLSARDPERPEEFLITASQTGGIKTLASEHLVRVSECSLERFWVEAIGAEPPSSETLTHAAIYASDPHIAWVIHAHSPEIWQQAEPLGLPCTDADVAYGSPAMVRATAELLDGYRSRPLVFAALGHEDGVFACGPTARDTGGLLVSYLARALAG
jgi:L-ribulose-5-phosphate 4-epimerase